MMRSALSSSSRWCSISTADSSSAVGLALSWPAMSGAVPCTASNTPMPSSPRLAAGTTPRPPTSPAHRSETMSPYRFGSSSTSSFSGCITRCMHAASTMRSSYWMSGIVARRRARAQSRNRPSLELHDVGLVHRRHALAAVLPRVLEREPRDPRRGLLGDDLQALDDARHDDVLEARRTGPRCSRARSRDRRSRSARAPTAGSRPAAGWRRDRAPCAARRSRW